MQVLDCLLAVAFHLPVPVVYDISCTSHVVIAPASDEVIDIELSPVADQLTQQLGLARQHERTEGEGPWQRPKRPMRSPLFPAPDGLPIGWHPRAAAERWASAALCEKYTEYGVSPKDT